MGWLDVFKRKPEEVIPLDLSWLKVDMHSHLIPGIDDGSKSMEESIDLVKRLAGYGLEKKSLSLRISCRNIIEILPKS